MGINDILKSLMSAADAVSPPNPWVIWNMNYGTKCPVLSNFAVQMKPQCNPKLKEQMFLYLMEASVIAPGFRARPIDMAGENFFKGNK